MCKQRDHQQAKGFLCLQVVLHTILYHACAMHGSTIMSDVAKWCEPFHYLWMLGKMQTFFHSKMCSGQAVLETFYCQMWPLIHAFLLGGCNGVLGGWPVTILQGGWIWMCWHGLLLPAVMHIDSNRCNQLSAHPVESGFGHVLSVLGTLCCRKEHSPAAGTWPSS